MRNKTTQAWAETLGLSETEFLTWLELAQQAGLVSCARLGRQLSLAFCLCPQPSAEPLNESESLPPLPEHSPTAIASEPASDAPSTRPLNLPIGSGPVAAPGSDNGKLQTRIDPISVAPSSPSGSDDTPTLNTGYTWSDRQGLSDELKALGSLTWAQPVQVAYQIDKSGDVALTLAYIIQALEATSSRAGYLITLLTRARYAPKDYCWQEAKSMLREAIDKSG